MPERSKSKTELLENPLLHILIIVLIALCAYSNTLQVPFLFDDEGSIQLNTGVHGLSNFFNGGYDYLPNRVIGYFSFALNYQLGELNVVGYHIVNLLIHISCSLLVYGVVRVTLCTPILKQSFDTIQSGKFALVIALLYVSHPIQTQAVTYIVQRFTSLATLFYLASLLCYAQWRFARNDSAPLLNGWPWYVMSFLTALLAMKTKEIAFTLPLIILLYECSFFGWPGRKLLVQMTPLLLTVAVIPYTIYTTISPLLQSGGSLLSDNNSPAYNIIRVTRWEYLYTQFSVILTYIRLLILPVKQNLDYDYPINHSLLQAKTALSLLVLLLLSALALYLFAKSVPKPDYSESTSDHLQSKALYRLAAFGIFWFFITLSVESSIIIIHDVIFEHRLYLPSFGFFLALTSFASLGFIRLKQYFNNVHKAVLPIVTVIILILSGATYARNATWGNWITIWGDAAAKSPNKSRTHNVLGIGYFYELRFEEAMQEYREAIRLKPDFIEAYYNMGLIYKATKQYNESIYIYRKILSISAYDARHFAKVYNEIGISYSELGDQNQAVAAFAAAVKYNPEFVELRNNYAFALMSKGNLEDALREFKSVLSIDPNNKYAAEAILEIVAKKAGGTSRQVTAPQRVPEEKKPAN